MRTAGCCGVARLIACGNANFDPKVARNSADTLVVERRRTLVHVLRALAADGYTLVGLEQTSNSQNIHEYQFPRRTALVIGNERLGLSEDELKHIHECVEIPVWGTPHSYNVAAATAMALYEYCRQYPTG